eukprot:354946-Chlamydomonas_euryale.AAC.5
MGPSTERVWAGAGGSCRAGAGSSAGPPRHTCVQLAIHKVGGWVGGRVGVWWRASVAECRQRRSKGLRMQLLACMRGHACMHAANTCTCQRRTTATIVYRCRTISAAMPALQPGPRIHARMHASTRIHASLHTSARMHARLQTRARMHSGIPTSTTT